MKKGVKGFTFLEVMISLVLFGLILLMVLGTFRLSLSSWEKVEKQNDRTLRIRTLQNLMIHQIKSIFPYKVKTEKAEGDYLAFEGKPDALRFVSNYSMRSRRAEGLVYAAYLWKNREKLELYEGRVLRKEFFETPLKEDSLIFTLNGISKLTFEYLKKEKDEEEGTWLEEWEGKGLDPLPRAIRISFQLEGENEPITTSIQIVLPSIKFEEIGTLIPGLGRRTIRERLLRGGTE